MGKRKSTEPIISNETEAKKAKPLEEEEEEEVTNGETFEIKTTTDGRPAAVKICSWNVAGLKAWIKKDGLGYLQKEDADVVCLQETKCFEKDLPGEVHQLEKGGGKLVSNKSGYYMFWCNGEKKGYSGVALWSKEKPVSLKKGMGIKEHDNEGRLITAEFDKYYVVTSYVPNSGRKLVRLDYRRTWNTALKDHLNNLNKKKPVIFCGDLNVAHLEIDLANPKSNKKNAGFTNEEREDMTTLLNEGYIDSYRTLYPDKEKAYTFWTYMMNARSKNVGWRLDYFILSNTLKEHLCDNAIRSDVMGSDHCPIVLTLADPCNDAKTNNTSATNCTTVSTDNTSTTDTAADLST